MIDALPEPRQLVVSDGYALNYRLWEPRQFTGRALILLHGIQSHSAWYFRSCSHWAQNGWLVIAPDRRGSGGNFAMRGDVLHYSRWFFDLSAFIHLARTITDRPHHEEQETPKFQGFDSRIVLAGLSWGGRLAAAYTSLWPANVSACMLLYPGIYPRIQPNRLQQLLLELLQRTSLRSRLKEIPGLEPARFTNDPAAREFITNDPLALREATLRFLWNHQQLQPLAHRGLTEPLQPLFLALAGKDQIVDSGLTEQLFSQVLRSSSLPHELRQFEHAAHTLEFDSCFPEFLEHSTNWLNRVCPADQKLVSALVSNSLGQSAQTAGNRHNLLNR